jgi:hypothetical protein
MLGTLFNYANNGNEINSKTVNAKKVRVEFKNVKKGHLLTIKDKNGVQLHSETVTKIGDLNKTFDLSSLIDGTYTIELNKDFKIIVKTINVKNDRVFFNNNDNKVIAKPIISNNENILKISKINSNKEPLKVVVYYNSEIIYTETIENNTVLNRVYKLNKDITGEYTAIVYSNNRSYSKNFKI